MALPATHNARTGLAARRISAAPAALTKYARRQHHVCRDAAVVTAATITPERVSTALKPGKVNPIDAVDMDALMETSMERLVVVDVFTQWCGPCKMIAPELEKMAAEFGDKVIISKIDCTTNPDNKKWAMGQSVKALPTFIMFKDGKRVNDMTGAKAANLKKLIEAHM